MANCVLRYGCPAARNLAMERWECPLPTSRGCNAACLGCISHQPAETCVTASQQRIAFVPTASEIAGVAVPHLESAPRPVVSFGQGCEGEPLLQADLLEESIRLIRRRTSRGIINLNTNGSLPAAVERLCRAGLDSIRVSMCSAQERVYNAYYRPRGFAFGDVLETLRVMRHHNRWASINYFVFPGLTDERREIDALGAVLRDTRLNMIQARNLNMDPEWYIEALALGGGAGECVGVRAWIAEVRRAFPWVKFGYFNPPRSQMRAVHYAPQ
jgi:pyruvate-formate lyase-activating enzyme